MDQKYIAAIEIGSSKIKGAIGMLDRHDALTVVAVEEEKLTGDDLSDVVRYGIIQNVDKVANCVERIITRLEQSSSVAPRTIKKVYVALGARSMFAEMVEVDRQYHDDIDITEAFVQQLKEEARTIYIGDKEIVAVTPRSFNIDGASAPINPVGQFGRSIKATFMVVAIKPAAMRNIKRVITDRLELSIAGYIVRPLAEAGFALNDEERRLGCMLVDLGAETVTTTIYKGAVMRYLSVLPIGSRNITRDLMTLNYTEERANDIKCAIGNVEAEDPAVKNRNIDGLNNADIKDVITARAREIIANIMEQIHYAGMQPADLPAGIILVGAGSKLRGFLSLLKSVSKMTVRMGTPNEFCRIADSRLQANESIDILSTLWDISKNSPEECTESPQRVKDSLFDPDDEPEVVVTAEDEDTFIPEAGDNISDDEEVSRVGSDFGDSSLWGKKKKKEKAPKKPQEPAVWAADEEEDEEVYEDEPSDSSNKRGIFNGIKRRIQILLSEPEDGPDGFTNE